VGLFPRGGSDLFQLAGIEMFFKIGKMLLIIALLMGSTMEKGKVV
jgi:hypothetical protein